MARLAGYSGSVTYDGNTFDGVTSWMMDIEDGLPDATGMDSAGWREFIAGLKSWSATVTIKYDTDDEDEFEAGGSIVPGTAATLTLLAATGEFEYEGSAYVKRIHPEVRVDGDVEFTIDFQGTGALTYPSTA